jgi:hypothetical protein
MRRRTRFAALILGMTLLGGCAHEELTSPCVCTDWRTIGPEAGEERTTT